MTIDITSGPHATLLEAQEAFDKLMSAYNPLAYGTSLNIKKTDAGWMVQGYRYSTSD